MKRVLLMLTIACSFCFAQQNRYALIKSEIDKGNFKTATSMIDSVLEGNKNLTAAEISDLEFQKEKMNRIRLDFKKNEADMLSYLKKYYPDVDHKTLEKFEKDRSLESMLIDGEKKYFNRAAPNLFLINKEAMEQKEKVQGAETDALDKFLSNHIPEVVKNSAAQNSRIVNPVKMQITYTLSVKPNVVPDGEIIRCWLPFPREKHARQSDIKLLSVNSDEYTIADNNNPQRTLYMEKKAVKDEPTVFKMKLNYTCSSEWFDIDPSKVKQYDTESDFYKTYTSERPPHVVFTDEIKELSKRIVGNETNPYLKARLIFEWISNNIPWAGAREYSTLDNIPAYCLQNKHGDCGIKTLLFMTLARYNGIPAKWQSGWMMHPVEKNLHDWGEAYFEGYGWVPVDQSFGIQNYSSDPKVKYYYTNGIDSYRLIVNDDFSQPLYPAKIYPRSETVDFQRGEVEWRCGNLYFDKWDYDMDIKYLSEVVKK